MLARIPGADMARGSCIGCMRADVRPTTVGGTDRQCEWVRLRLRSRRLRKWSNRRGQLPRSHTTIQRAYAGRKRPQRLLFLRDEARPSKEIRDLVGDQFGYDLSFTIAEIRPTYEFNESCQDTVPQAITAFLESKGYEDAIRLAISLGGDADTLACIAGGIAGAFYGGVPPHIATPAWSLLDDRLRAVVTDFCAKFQIKLS